MDSPLVNALLWSAVVPGTVAALVVAAARPWRARGEGPDWFLPALAAVAVAAAYLAAHRGIVGKLEITPRDVTHWLPHVAVIGGLASIAQTVLRRKAAAAWAVRIVTSLAVSWLILRPLVGVSWTDAQGYLYVLLAAATLLVHWTAIERVVASERPRVAPAFPLALAIAGAVGAATSGTALIGQLAGAAAAGVGGVFVVALVFPRADLGRAVVAGAATMSWAAIAIAYFYASMRPSVLVLLGIAAVAAYGTRLAAARLGLVRFAAAPALLLALALIGGAAFIGAADDGTGASTADDESDYGYGYID